VDDQGNTTGPPISSTDPAPSKEQVLSLTSVGELRPSTVLGYLFSCAPLQLPLPLVQEMPMIEGINFFDVLFQLTGMNNNGTERQENEQNKMIFQSFQPSFQLLYLPIEERNQDKNVNVKHIKWKQYENEMKCWELYQKCLDLFLQRLNTVDDATEKQILRQWYELLQAAGSQYFS
jgi:hypothetical protein